MILSILGSRLLAGALLLLAGAPCAAAQLMLMPQPSRVRLEEGRLKVDSNFAVHLDGYSEPRMERADRRFYAVLSQRTGIMVWTPAAKDALQIHIEGPGQPVQQVGEDESYRLTIDSQRAILHAATPLGAMHGLQTLLQLVSLDGSGFYLPAVTIEDTPRFSWRGLMIDSSRHFLPLAVLKRNLDGMEAAKLNVFHWHLSDDQGFRAEVSTLPSLAKNASDDMFYTESEMREIVEYAHDRGIRVVPEIDMPAHVSAILAAFPELGSGLGPYAIERKWGIFNPALDPTREETYLFVDKLLTALTPIFPDSYFHIGGDECNGKEWTASARIRAFMLDHAMKDTDALQAYFSGRVQKLVAAHARTPIGWDEILQPGTSADVVIQSWHGPQALAKAVRSGHKAILSKGYYLDLNLPASDYYAVDPLSSELRAVAPAEQANVLGGEAAMWTEYVSSETVDSRIWPRTAAIAERLWSPAAMTQDPASMYARMAVFSKHLESYDLQHNAGYPRMLERIANGRAVTPLQTLGDVEQPPKNHDRAHLGAYDQAKPLNHLVDAIPVESSLSREFSLLCSSIAQGSATPSAHVRVRALLTLWQENDARLQPTLKASSLAAELGPASSSLEEAATIGLDALNHLEAKTPMLNREAAQHALDTDAKPHAAMFLAIAPFVRLLIDATER